MCLTKRCQEHFIEDLKIRLNPDSIDSFITIYKQAKTITKNIYKPYFTNHTEFNHYYKNNHLCYY